MRLRKLVIFDRLLARLLVAAPERWLLKGALALDYRLGTRARTTRDMDLARADSEEQATEDLLAAQDVDLGDFFTFAVERTSRLDALHEGAAMRYHVAVALAGRPFEDVVVDVGFGDPFADPPERLRGPDLLGFADIPPVEVPALPLEQQVAEKLHAYTRGYGGGRGSTRVKDLVDLVLIRSHTSCDAGRLRAALQAVFAGRGAHALPSALPAPPADWGPPYRRLATEVGLAPDLATGHALAAAFLDPVLAAALPAGARWEPGRGAWGNPG
jgi:hypothetical protein